MAIINFKSRLLFDLNVYVQTERYCIACYFSLVFSLFVLLKVSLKVPRFIDSLLRGNVY